MSQLGESVVQAMDFLRSFYSDVSRLVTGVNEQMIANGLVSLWGSRCFWDASTAYDSPTHWQPS
jgi:hypothetical protein